MIVIHGKFSGKEFIWEVIIDIVDYSWSLRQNMNPRIFLNTQVACSMRHRNATRWHWWHYFPQQNVWSLFWSESQLMKLFLPSVAKGLTDIEYHEVKLQEKKTHRVRVTPFLNGKITNFKASICFFARSGPLWCSVVVKCWNSISYSIKQINIRTPAVSDLCPRCFPSRPVCRCVLGRCCWQKSPPSWSERPCRICWKSTSRKAAMAEERSKPSSTTRWVSTPLPCLRASERRSRL